MRLFFVFACLLFTLFSFSSFSQTPAIDSLLIRYTNPQDQDELVPPSITDTAIQNLKINVHVSFLVINPNNLKELTIGVGKQSGKSEYRKWKLSCVKQGQVYYLTIGNKFFPIVNGKVFIDDNIPVAALKKALYITMQPVDLNNQLPAPYIKKLN